MDTQRTDFLVGLFILVAVGVVAGMGIVTSGLGEKRIDVYLRAASAQALSQDTRVVLGGLTIGRVREISPVVDSTTGGISFVARLSLQERFPNGTQLVLPAGTRAVISQPNPIAAAQIDLADSAGPAARIVRCSQDEFHSADRNGTGQPGHRAGTVLPVRLVPAQIESAYRAAASR